MAPVRSAYMEVNDPRLDNIVWHALTTEHRAFAEGTGAARRYAPDVSVFAALESFEPDAWSDLAATAGAGHVVVLFRDDVQHPPSGWSEVMRGTGVQMVFDGVVEPISEPSTLRPLTQADVPAMLALVELTRPGPFVSRTIELGGYLGVFEDDELVAMAGRRFRLDGFVEVSAVCTHPRAERRGLGAVMTMQVAARIADEGHRPLLHVAQDNTGARRVYERIGFVARRTVAFAALRTPGPDR